MSEADNTPAASGDTSAQTPPTPAAPAATPPAPAPSAPAAPQAAPATPPAPAAPTPAPVSLTSDQLSTRLKEASASGQRAMAKELGFEKPEDLKAALGRLKQLEDANKTETERLQSRIKELEPLEKEAPALRTTLATMVNDQFAALPENVQKAIDTIANGDPNKRFEQMRVFQASGLLASQATPAAPAAAAPAAAAPPAPAPAPPVSATPSPAPAPAGAPTPYQKWQELSARSGLLGDLFYQNNMQAIENSRPSAG